MKKNTILYILLAFLIVANGFFLVNYLGRPQKPDGQNGPGDFIVKELKFNDSQMSKFQDISAIHHDKMSVIFNNERQLKDELFSKLSEPMIDDSVIDSITTRIGNNDKLRDETTFYFFKEIKALCNQEQKERLGELLHKALRGNGRPDAPPPPKRN